MPLTKRFTTCPTDGNGWLDLEPFRLVFSSDSCFSYQSHVSRVGGHLRYQVGDEYSSPARILVRKDNLEDAKQVLGRVYPYATQEQVGLKVMDRS